MFTSATRLRESTRWDSGSAGSVAANCAIPTSAARLRKSARYGEPRYVYLGDAVAQIGVSLHYGSAGRGAPDAMRCRVRKWEFV